MILRTCFFHGSILPNIVIYDFARGLSTHTDLRQPQTIPFTPFEGRLMDPTAENIKKAKAGNVKVSLPWLTCKKENPDPDGHPITGSAEHYVLYDQFHEDNTKDARDSLRKLRLVPQLAGKVICKILPKHGFAVDSCVPHAKHNSPLQYSQK